MESTVDYPAAYDSRAAVSKLTNTLQKNLKNAAARSLQGENHLENDDATAAGQEFFRVQIFGAERPHRLKFLNEAR